MENDRDRGKCKSFFNHWINQLCLVSKEKLRFEIIDKVIASITHVLRKTCDSRMFVNINLVVIDLKYAKYENIKHWNHK